MIKELCLDLAGNKRSFEAPKTFLLTGTLNALQHVLCQNSFQDLEQQKQIEIKIHYIKELRKILFFKYVGTE